LTVSGEPEIFTRTSFTTFQVIQITSTKESIMKRSSNIIKYH